MPHVNPSQKVGVLLARDESHGSGVTVVATEPGDPNVPDHAPGSVSKPRVWHRIFSRAGINQLDFSQFVDDTCSNLEESPAPNGCDDRRVFLWDDCAARYTPLVYETVEGRESKKDFLIVPRSPDQPKYGPTEYSIMETVSEVQRNVLNSWTTEDMVGNIRQALTTGFGWHGASQRRFHYCGYRFDDH